MNRRSRSALFGIFLMASQILQGGLAASVPCDDDSLGVLVPCATAEQSGATTQDVAPAREASSPTCHAEQHCRYVGTDACHMMHVPALAVSIVPSPSVQLHTFDASAPPVDSFAFQFDLILRPPK